MEHLVRHEDAVCNKSSTMWGEIDMTGQQQVNYIEKGFRRGRALCCRTGSVCVGIAQQTYARECGVRAALQGLRTTLRQSVGLCTALRGVGQECAVLPAYD